MNTVKPLTLSAETIIKATHVDEAKLKEWEAQGLKEAKRGSEGYDARQFYLWYRDNVYRPNLVEGAEGDEEVILDVMTHRARYEKARAQKYKIKLQLLKDQFIPVEEAELTLYELGALFEKMAKKLPKLLTKSIVNKTEADMLVNIDTIIRKLLFDYSRLGNDNSTNKNKKQNKS